MSIKINYKNKTQSVKQWSIELDIPTGTIYKRLKFDWPPELVLSKHRFHFCWDYKAAVRIEQREGYPSNLHLSKAVENTNTKCCTNKSICHFAIPITDWNDIKDDPSEANYYCKLERKFVWGENPVCV